MDNFGFDLCRHLVQVELTMEIVKVSVRHIRSRAYLKPTFPSILLSDKVCASLMSISLQFLSTFLPFIFVKIGDQNIHSLV